ncbi:MAG: threonine synthase [Oscillospiraceae bacterium]|jgi:threonine synthase|nr:threonine synthase [Oscillospiraceae bacterium]
MPFLSTRGEKNVTASQAILRGLAPDGGLYVPAAFPVIPLADVAAMATQPYPVRAARVLGALLDDYRQQELAQATALAYARFDGDGPAPLRALAPNLHMLELYHGPTLAFKDMALQLLPHLTRLAMDKNGEQRELFVLVATSGDTGKAALEGYCGVPGTRCAVFFPSQGVSEAQRLQMVTQAGANTHAIAVCGNFDDAQNGVKRIFADADFAKTMHAQGRTLSSANSINFGRLAPQVAYYFSAYADLLATGAITPGQRVHFAVPTGNFGNILAAEYARRMGLPVGKLLCASNSNNVLTDFLATGVYDANRPFHQTISPSMDILISSNLERLLFELCGRDASAVSAWMRALRTGGRYDIGATHLSALRGHFLGAWVDDGTTRATIRQVWRDHRRLLDPHTAVAARALLDYRQQTGDMAPAVVVSTASPFKFGRDVAQALFEDPAADAADDFACCRRLADTCGLTVPPAIAQLPALPIRHTLQTDPADMALTLLRALG